MLDIIDLHSDTMMACYFEQKPFRDFPGHINIEKLQKGGAMCQALALFIATDGHMARDGVTLPWGLYKQMLACWKREVAANSDVLRPAFTAADIRKNAADGFISALLTVEDGIGIDGRIERLEEMYEDGVRMLALTWNFENSIGFPNSQDPEKHMLGLKPFGLEVVERMNDLGMLVDVSHLSEGGFYDVARVSKKPFVASHSCCRALRDRARNLTDAQLRTIGNAGGVVGMNFCSDFLSEDRRHTYARDIVRHMVHLKNVAGIEALAWGSDFDGIESNMDFGDYAGFPIIMDLMEKEFTYDELDKINHDNFLRVADDVLG